MRSDLLLSAAAELERAAELPIDQPVDWLISKELVELAARLRHVSRSLGAYQNGRPVATASPAPAPVQAQPPLALSRQQAAELLGVSERTIDRLEKSGELKAARLGRAVRFDRGELERYLRREVA